jgi:hypothetical protein
MWASCHLVRRQSMLNVNATDQKDTFNEKNTTLHTLIDAHKKSEGKGEGEDRTPFGEFQKTF